MAHDQSLRQRIADLTDTDLKRTAVAHQPRGMKTDGVFGVRDRLGWRREQWKFGGRTFQHCAELLCRQIARPRHEWQFGVDLPDKLERGLALLAGTQDVEGGIGIAAQAVARDAIDHPL